MTNKNELLVAESIKIEQDHLIDLWDFDLRRIGGPIYHFCNEVNEKNEAVKWKGVTYEPYPIKSEGFEKTAEGASNRPKLSVGNVLGLITGAVEQYDQLVGAVVIRRQTYAKFLDADNFVDGNEYANPAEELESKYLIERLVSLDSTVAAFELAFPSEADGAIVPARIILANVCTFEYRGTGCSYTGGPVADEYDMPTNDMTKDSCSKSCLGCSARFGLDAVLPYGAYVAADKVGG